MPALIVVAAVAVIRDDHVLTVRKQGTSRFMLVGGKLEAGESAHAAAIRETREEVGLQIDDLELLGEFVSDAANEPGHTLHSTVFAAELTTTQPAATNEIAELRWTDLARARSGEFDDLAPLLQHHVLPVLIARRAGR